MVATPNLKPERGRAHTVGWKRREPTRNAGTKEVAATCLEVLPGDLPCWICHADLLGPPDLAHLHLGNHHALSGRQDIVPRSATTMPGLMKSTVARTRRATPATRATTTPPGASFSAATSA